MYKTLVVNSDRIISNAPNQQSLDGPLSLFEMRQMLAAMTAIHECLLNLDGISSVQLAFFNWVREQIGLNPSSIPFKGYKITKILMNAVLLEQINLNEDGVCNHYHVESCSGSQYFGFLFKNGQPLFPLRSDEHGTSKYTQ